MQIAMITIHLLACIIMVLVVLLQTGKGASLGAAFGGASQTVFGSSGAQTFLGKLTTAVAIIFMITSLVLSVGSLGGSSSSLMQDTAKQAPAATQAATAAAEQTDQAAATAAPAQSQAVEDQKPQATAQAAAPAAEQTTAPAKADAPAAKATDAPAKADKK